MEEGRLITYNQLYDAGACTDYRQQFAEMDESGNGLTVTVEAAIEQAKEWDWTWAAEYLLNPVSQEAYKQAIAPAWRAYNTVMGPLWDELDKARQELTDLEPDSSAASREAFDRIVAPVRTRVYKQEDVEMLKLQQARARAFAELYIKEGEVKNADS